MQYEDNILSSRSGNSKRYGNPTNRTTKYPRKFHNLYCVPFNNISSQGSEPNERYPDIAGRKCAPAVYTQKWLTGRMDGY